jgi:hypothetical protein
MGGIDLDVASSARANETVRAAKYYTKKDDALLERHVWRGRTWFQPPYSMTGAFVAKLLVHHDRGLVPSAVCLLNADTGTSWFHALARVAPLCLTKGRISYVTPDGKRQSGTRQAQVFFGIGDAALHERFEEKFAQYGAVGRLEVLP